MQPAATSGEKATVVPILARSTSSGVSAINASRLSSHGMIARQPPQEQHKVIRTTGSAWDDASMPNVPNHRTASGNMLPPRQPGRLATSDIPTLRTVDSSVSQSTVTKPRRASKENQGNVRFADDMDEGSASQHRGEFLDNQSDHTGVSNPYIVAAEEGYPTKPDGGHGGDDDSLTGSQHTSLSDATSTSSSGSGVKDAGVTKIRLCGRKIKIPFTFWTFVAMVVPVGLVVAMAAMNLHTVAAELETLDAHIALAQDVSECSTALMEERARSGLWAARRDSASYAALQLSRGPVQDVCFNAVLHQLRGLSSGRIRGADWRAMYALVDQYEIFLMQLTAQRGAVDNLTVTNVRKFFTVNVQWMTSILATVANRLVISARRYVELTYLISARNYITLARGTGNIIAAAGAGSLADTSLAAGAVNTLYPEYLSGYNQALLATSMLTQLPSEDLSAQIAVWRSTPDYERMWFLLDTMADLGNNGPQLIQSVYFAAWYPNMSAAIDQLVTVEAWHLNKITEAPKAHKQLTQSALFLSLGVTACLIAAGLLAWQQSRVRGQLEKQVESIERTRRAVSAFVPRFFLQKMGYTSITQVRTGESTNVALAMLFADIRRFTTVSEGMSCTELFTWVQGYFQRMTRIVEGRRGNVNEFMGDALFAVFSTCKDAMLCAVDMQSDVQQLNVQRLCEAKSGSVPIEVGVGIHHDVVAMGILGDDSRHTCTTISASVNLASRLEGLTKQVGCRILASEAVIDQLSSADSDRLRFRRLGAVVVKGSGSHVVVYDVFQTDLRELQLYKEETREAFERLVQAVICGQISADEVMESLSKVDLQHPEDLLASPTTTDLPRTGRTAPPSPRSAVDVRIDAGLASLIPTAADFRADLAVITAAMTKFAVRDVPLEVFAGMTDGSGRVTFDAK